MDKMKNIAGLTREKLWTKSFTCIVLVNLLTYLGNFVLMSTLPLHVLNIGGNKIMAGLITGIYSLTGLISRLQIGSLLDRKDRKIIMLSGLAVLLLVILSYNAAAYSIIMLFALRAVHGLGWSTITTSTSTIASDLIPAERRNEGMGFFGISISVAMVIGPGLGLYVMNHYTHTALFLLSACFILLALLAGFSRNYHNPGQPVKLPNTAEIRENSKNTRTAAIEKTALWPSFIFLIIVMTYSTIMIFLPPYVREKGLSDIGSFYTMMALAMILTRFTTGRIADRYGTTKVVVPGMLLLAIALQLLFMATSLPMFFTAAIIYGLGFGAVQPALNALVISLAPAKRRGAANATFLGAMDIGGIIGAIVWGVVAQVLGFSYIYSASAILIVLSVAMYLVAVFKGKLNKTINDNSI